MYVTRAGGRKKKEEKEAQDGITQKGERKRWKEIWKLSSERSQDGRRESKSIKDEIWGKSSDE